MFGGFELFFFTSREPQSKRMWKTLSYNTFNEVPVTGFNIRRGGCVLSITGLTHWITSASCLRIYFI